MKPLAIVFGCTGQDGGYLCKSLLNKDFEVIGTTRTNQPNLKRLLTLGIADKVQIVRCDLEDFDQTKNIINRFRPSEIYNLSAQSSVGDSFKNPAETQKSIVNTTLNILEVSRETNFQGNLFFAGSSEIFGSTDTPASLSAKIDLRSPYAIAKYQSFLLSKMYRQIYKINCVTGILFNHESALRDNRFVLKKIINAALRIKNRKSEKIILGDITIKRDWGYAKEYVEAMQLINRSDLNRDYIVCTGISYSLQKIVEKIFEELELNWLHHITISKDLYRPNEIKNSSGNPTAIFKDLGWKSQIKVDDLIRKLINHEIQKK
jgi:GDPmannose 4,6-dehydratase